MDFPVEVGSSNYQGSSSFLRIDNNSPKDNHVGLSNKSLVDLLRLVVSRVEISTEKDLVWRLRRKSQSRNPILESGRNPFRDRFIVGVFLRGDRSCPTSFEESVLA